MSSVHSNNLPEAELLQCRQESYLRDLLDREECELGRFTGRWLSTPDEASLIEYID